WAVDGELDAGARRALQLGGGLGACRLTRYRDAPRAPGQLVAGVLDAETAGILAARLRERDRVNTPTQDMGPQQVEDIGVDAAARRALQLGWGLGAYRFTRYRDAPRAPAQLVAGELDAKTADILAACLRGRDLVNTPTQDMGPQQLEDIARETAQTHGAKFE